MREQSGGSDDLSDLERELRALAASVARVVEEPLETERIGRELAEVQAHLFDIRRRIGGGAMPAEHG